jgi:hypothetical protein
MSNAHLEVADIFRHHGSAYLEKYGNAISAEQRRVMNDILNCRTRALGGAVKECDRCGHKETFFHSCRNRHCPKCQAAARGEWLDARAHDLLSAVQYYHVVFTITAKLAPLALQNKSVLYALLFRAVSETLKAIAQDPKHLGAGQIGFLAVLHTWSQRLEHHPHLHCVIPGGGISLDGNRWIPCRKEFFLPVRILSALFQKKFLSYLNAAYQKGELSFYGKLKQLGDPKIWKCFLSSLYDVRWVVYAKPPFGGPEQVLKYLAGYTHRVAISNHRLISLQDGKVTFRWKDRAKGNEDRTLTLDAVEFLRRFLQHTLPSGFMRIRHYGFLSNRSRRDKLPLVRKLLADAQDQTPAPIEVPKELTTNSDQPERFDRCPVCKEGRMRLVEEIKPDLNSRYDLTSTVVPADTS